MSWLHQLGAAAGRWWRWGGLLLLALGVIVGWRAFPRRADGGWESPHAFELDGAACRELRRQRLTTTWSVPDGLGRPVTVAEAAGKYGLELVLVCRANALPAGDCARQSRFPGDDPLLFPLDREPPSRPAPEASPDAP